MQYNFSPMRWWAIGMDRTLSFAHVTEKSSKYSDVERSPPSLVAQGCASRQGKARVTSLIPATAIFEALLRPESTNMEVDLHCHALRPPRYAGDDVWMRARVFWSCLCYERLWLNAMIAPGALGAP